MGIYKEINIQIDELEAKKKELAISIMQQMKEKILQFPGFVVKHYQQLSIKISLEQARFLNAIKMEETVDTEKIKNLVNPSKESTSFNTFKFLLKMNNLIKKLGYVIIFEIFK